MWWRHHRFEGFVDSYREAYGCLLIGAHPRQNTRHDVQFSRKRSYSHSLWLGGCLWAIALIEVLCVYSISSKYYIYVYILFTITAMISPLGGSQEFHKALEVITANSTTKEALHLIREELISAARPPSLHRRQTGFRVHCAADYVLSKHHSAPGYPQLPSISRTQNPPTWHQHHKTGDERAVTKHQRSSPLSDHRPSTVGLSGTPTNSVHSVYCDVLGADHCTECRDARSLERISREFTEVRQSLKTPDPDSSLGLLLRCMSRSDLSTEKRKLSSAPKSKKVQFEEGPRPLRKWHLLFSRRRREQWLPPGGTKAAKDKPSSTSSKEKPHLSPPMIRHRGVIRGPMPPGQLRRTPQPPPVKTSPLRITSVLTGSH